MIELRPDNQVVSRAGRSPGSSGVGVLRWWVVKGGVAVFRQGPSPQRKRESIKPSSHVTRTDSATVPTVAGGAGVFLEAGRVNVYRTRMYPGSPTSDFTKITS